MRTGARAKAGAGARVKAGAGARVKAGIRRSHLSLIDQMISLPARFLLQSCWCRFACIWHQRDAQGSGATQEIS